MCQVVAISLQLGFTIMFPDYFSLIFFSKMINFREKNQEIKVLMSANLK